VRCRGSAVRLGDHFERELCLADATWANQRQQWRGCSQEARTLHALRLATDEPVEPDWQIVRRQRSGSLGRV